MALEVCGKLLDDNSTTTEHRPESAVTHAFDNVDEQIAAFCDAFTSLREDFDSRLSLSTALVVSRFASSVDMMGMYAYTFSHFTLSYNFTQFAIKY